MSDSDVNCGSGGGSDAFLGLRIASVFIIWAGSSFGALFPVLARRTTLVNVPKWLFDFAKYFGSGVIIGTAFIHLLSPALDELGGDAPCLSPAWQEYPYALALALLSIFSIFIVELVAFRIGTAKLQKLGIHHDAHGHGIGALAAHGPESQRAGESDPGPGAGEATIQEEGKDTGTDIDIESGDVDKMKHGHGHHYTTDEHGHSHENAVAAQIIGVAILEFGVLLHSVLIGLTLAVNEDFKVLFIVIIFHQLFEGLGIGSRLAYLSLPQKYNHIPILAAALYGLTTPIGIAVGLGVRTTYNPDSARASIVSGVLDALSAGILIYTGLVELLAHEFLFSREMREASNKKLVYAVGCMLLGCGLMALLGKWA